jgi:hypothetical protein
MFMFIEQEFVNVKPGEAASQGLLGVDSRRKEYAMRVGPLVLALPLVAAGCDDGAAAGACSGHGTLRSWSDVAVCECETGYTADPADPETCVPTATLCRGGAIDFDVDGDGTNETRFDPTALECEMYELVNRTRAGHDAEGTPECHHPLAYDVEWSAHARNHSKQMSDRGDLFHDDYPSGQNCAYGCGPACEMNMYMTGAGEDHCPPLSHHCNIMRCGFSAIGIGYWPPEDGTYNTQNFL